MPSSVKNSYGASLLLCFARLWKPGIPDGGRLKGFLILAATETEWATSPTGPIQPKAVPSDIPCHVAQNVSSDDHGGFGNLYLPLFLQLVLQRFTKEHLQNKHKVISIGYFWNSSDALIEITLRFLKENGFRLLEINKKPQTATLKADTICCLLKRTAHLWANLPQPFKFFYPSKPSPSPCTASRRC